VVLDRLRADEQPRRDLAVGRSLGDRAADLQLVRRQLLRGARIAAPRHLPRCRQLAPGALGPGLCAEALERLDREAQLDARAPAAAGAAQALAEAEARPRLGHRIHRAGVVGERPDEALLEALVGSEQPLAASDERELAGIVVVAHQRTRIPQRLLPALG